RDDHVRRSCDRDRLSNCPPSRKRSLPRPIHSIVPVLPLSCQAGAGSSKQSQIGAHDASVSARLGPVRSRSVNHNPSTARMEHIPQNVRLPEVCVTPAAPLATTTHIGSEKFAIALNSRE